MSVLKNQQWDRPQDWSILTDEEKTKWNEITDNLEQFYLDMKQHKHINPALSSYASPVERLSNQFFYKILEDQDKIYRAGNMLYSISKTKRGTSDLIKLSQGRLNENDFPYVLLTTYTFMLILSYESNMNVLRKTLTTNYLTNKKGDTVKKEIEKMAPANLLSMLRKYSKNPVKYIENIIFKHQKLRDAFSHGLFWCDNERIFYVDNVNSSTSKSIIYKEFLDTVREQSLSAQCFLWVGGKLITERFFEPW